MLVEGKGWVSWQKKEAVSAGSRKRLGELVEGSGKRLGELVEVKRLGELAVGRGGVSWKKEESGELLEGRGWVSWQKKEAV